MNQYETLKKESEKDLKETERLRRLHPEDNFLKSHYNRQKETYEKFVKLGDMGKFLEDQDINLKKNLVEAEKRVEGKVEEIEQRFYNSTNSRKTLKEMRKDFSRKYGYDPIKH
jgi:hypothetical protein|tara:strand:+ start:574 stop:912 length:339 start_codon:yes stop_codon:yes gene_type:complete